VVFLSIVTEKTIFKNVIKKNSVFFCINSYCTMSFIKMKRQKKNKSAVGYHGISTLEVLVDAKNYNKWIADQIIPHVLSPVMEIGAGTGNLTKHFLMKKPLYITDSDVGLVAHLKKIFKKEKNIVITKFDITKAPAKKFIASFSTVYGINVLEHIKDDKQALKNIYRILRKGGKLLLLVPAKKIAYTKLDKELGHFRRYEEKELIHIIKKSGFTIEKIYYFNIVGLLSWIVRDKVERQKIQLNAQHIKIFDSIVPILRRIESIVKIPVGISLIVIAKKI